MKYNTRFAPSPSGIVHFGNIRTAYFNWLAARATGGKFLLRIDDTDLERSKDEFITPIYETMNWLGLDYDSTFKQSERGDAYKAYTDALLLKGLAFTDDTGAIRLRWNDTFPRSWKDDVVGDVKISDDDISKMDGMVIVRSPDKGGMPIYHFASVVDDYESNINLIIRGTDHITNTSRQVAIWSALNMAITALYGAGQETPIPRFAHIGLIFASGKKLAKRDGAASMLTYKNNGIHPEAMLNFMLRLGWGPTVDDKSTAMLPTSRALELFLDGGKMKSSQANADFLKLESFDRKYKGRDENVRRLAEKLNANS